MPSPDPVQNTERIRQRNLRTAKLAVQTLTKPDLPDLMAALLEKFSVCELDAALSRAMRSP